MKLTYKKTKGFTLIELLVVIAIIAVLAALATPAIFGVLKKAKITRATSICTSLETAVNQFENEYNYLPYGGGTSPTADEEVRSDDELMAILAGAEEDLNFKKIRFFETGEPKGTNASTYRDGMIVTGTNAALYDPWGETYYIIIDYDLDGGIENPFDDQKTVTKKAAIYSLGPDMKEGDLALNKDNPANF